MIKKGSNKVKFVKAVKEVTNLGLKLAKDWCDGVTDNPHYEHTLEINTTLEKFKEILRNNTDYEFNFEDRIKKRQLKLIALGLGDDIDKVDIISEDLALKLNLITREKSSESLYSIYKDFLSDFLLNLDPEQLNKLINNRNEDTQGNTE